MKIPQLVVAFVFSALSVLPTNALVISEVLANEVGSDTTGEWIEIFNNTGLTIDLSNYKIGDEETSGGTGAGESLFQFPAGASIAPGAIQIVAVSATRFNTVYGFLPTYEFSSTDLTVPDLLIYSTWDPDGGMVNMANGNDQAFILDGNDALVDAVNWGNNSFLNPGISTTTATLDGQSYERSNALTDSDTAADWVYGPAAATATFRSTPGVVSIPEPSTWALLGLGLAGLGIRQIRKLPSLKR